MFAVQAKNGFVEGDLWLSLWPGDCVEMANRMGRSRILSIAAGVRAMIAEEEAVAPFTVGDFSPHNLKSYLPFD